MRLSIFNPKAPKRPANLSVNSDLLQQAKEHKINLSKALEQCLIEMLLEEKRLAWGEENREAIDEYNKKIESRGIFSDGLRSF
ncbi:MAG: type II toxin-antitoxin system CcdA family antitoxin [Candidatus Ozemobacteraceae bacterium]